MMNGNGHGHYEATNGSGANGKSSANGKSKANGKESSEGLSKVEELVSSVGAIRPHHGAFLELVKNSPHNFCKSQGGKKHSFELLVTLMKRGEGRRYVGYNYDLTAYLVYSDNLAIVRQPGTLKVPIFQVMDGSTGILEDGIASVRLRINDVARNHCCRKFRVILVARRPGAAGAAVPNFGKLFNLGVASSATSRARVKQWNTLCSHDIHLPPDPDVEDSVTISHDDEEGGSGRSPKVVCGNAEIEARIQRHQQQQKRRKSKKKRKKATKTMKKRKAINVGDQDHPSAKQRLSITNGVEIVRRPKMEAYTAIAACITEPITVISKVPWSQRKRLP